MATEFWYNDSGTWRKMKEVWYNDSGTWRKARELWYNDSGTWRKIFSGFTLTGSNFSCSIFASSTAPTVTFQTDGTVTINGTGTSGNWGTPTTSGIGSGYWARATKTAGTGTVGGSMVGTFVQLNVAQNVNMNAAPAGNARDATVLYEIADNSSGTPVLASGTINLISDRT